MRLFMIRHGETKANVEEYFYAEGEDLPLTHKGREQAESIRPVLEKFTFDRVYSSDYLRAIQTQQIVMPEAECIRLPVLREMDPGDLGGESYKVLYDETRFEDITAFGDERSYSVVNGESMEDVANRLRVFLKELEENPCDRVAAFVHNGVLVSMLRLVLGADKFKRRAASSANCAVHVFDFDGKMWKLRAWNYGAPLD